VFTDADFIRKNITAVKRNDEAVRGVSTEADLKLYKEEMEVFSDFLSQECNTES
jgi:hypothetical protein